MARGIGRRGEFAVRAALGASRGRLVRQLVVESLVLSSSAVRPGLLCAYWATQALVVLTAGALTAGTSEPIRLDATCLLFTFAVSTVTALAFGLVPARQASRVDPQTALRERTRGATADRRHHRVEKHAGGDRGGAGGRAAGRRRPAAAHLLESRSASTSVFSRPRRSRWACSSACARRRLESR